MRISIIESLEQEKQEIQKQIDEIRSEIDKVQKDYNAARAKLPGIGVLIELNGKKFLLMILIFLKSYNTIIKFSLKV